MVLYYILIASITSSHSDTPECATLVFAYRHILLVYHFCINYHFYVIFTSVLRRIITLEKGMAVLISLAEDLMLRRQVA